jgi:hypothetical protein
VPVASVEGFSQKCHIAYSYLSSYPIGCSDRRRDRATLAAMQVWAAPYRSLSPNSSSGLWQIAFQSKLSEIEDSVNQLRENHRVLPYSGLLLGYSLYSYHVRELLICWLFFIVLFVLLALLVFGGVLACSAGKYASQWVRTAAPASPVLALASAELHLKIIADAKKLN